MASTGVLVFLQGVTLLRGGMPIFKDLDIAIKPRDHHVIIGSSGTGKSSLLGLICGVLRADCGHVRVCGTDLAQQPSRTRDKLRAQQMGVIFQTLGLASALPVWGNLKLAQRLAGKEQDDAFAFELLRRLGLADRTHAKPRHLSRGEAQRAAIARALVVKPALIIADEPTASLDETWRDQVMDVIRQEAEQHGATIVMSTHDPGIAARFENQIKLPQGRPI